MLKVGVLGVGMWGINHVRVLKELEEEGLAEPVGIYDVDMNRAEEVSKKFDVEVMPTEELFGASEAVIISTPPSTHAELTIEALRRGLHVLVEKPMAISMEEAREMVRIADDRGLKLLVGHIERYNPAIMKLKEVLGAEIIGDLVLISARRIGPKGRRKRDIGVILDLATHDIDVIRYLTGMEPVRICSKYGSKFGEYEDFALIFLDFNGFSSIVETNLLTPYKLRELYITGTNGVVKVDYIDQDIVIDRADGRIIPKIERREPLKEELRHFIKVIEEVEEPICDGYEGMKTLEIALAALENPEMECVKRER